MDMGIPQMGPQQDFPVNSSSRLSSSITDALAGLSDTNPNLSTTSTDESTGKKSKQHTKTNTNAYGHQQ